MSMREVNVNDIKETVKELFMEANIVLRADVVSALEKLAASEEREKARDMLNILIENARIAKDKKMPICQDTGIPVVFLELGSGVSLGGGDLEGAINEGVKEAYEEGLFRKSVVGDPLLRDNTNTNTPAITHTEIVKGDKIKIAVLPKGFGCENKGMVAMLNPTSSESVVVDFCVDAVKKAGPDACPPYVLGVGIGGTLGTSALLAKKALLRDINSSNPKEHIAKLEKKIFEKVTKLDIGVMGLGGASTVMGVNIEEGPTHIAGLPVAVNISCHALRSATAVI